MWHEYRSLLETFAGGDVARTQLVTSAAVSNLYISQTMARPVG